MRGVKPDLWADEDLAERSIWARWIFPGLWTQADREGRLIDSPKRLKRELLPYDDQDMDALLQELHDHRFIVRYEIDGQRFIWIPNFEKHQRISGSEVSSELEIPEWEGEATWKRTGHTCETSGNNDGSTEEASRKSLARGPRKERNKKEKGIRKESASADFFLPDFLPEEFRTPELKDIWTQYIEYRKEMGSPPYKERGLAQLAAVLRESGISASEIPRLIRHCMSQTWKGLPPGVIQEWNDKNAIRSDGKPNGHLNGHVSNGSITIPGRIAKPGEQQT